MARSHPSWQNHAADDMTAPVEQITDNCAEMAQPAALESANQLSAVDLEKLAPVEEPVRSVHGIKVRRS